HQLHSCPTRRSSDLRRLTYRLPGTGCGSCLLYERTASRAHQAFAIIDEHLPEVGEVVRRPGRQRGPADRHKAAFQLAFRAIAHRSEEHTSELQSREN